MDTPREHARLNEIWASGAAPWRPDLLRPTMLAPAPTRVGGLVMR